MQFIISSLQLPGTQLFLCDLSALVQRGVALFLSLILSPLLGFLAFVIKCDDGGSVFFLQQRIGLNGRRFTIYKLRTMDAGKVTRCGRWLRQTGLDELPQLWNIVLGDMLFVGPRPLTSCDVQRLGWHTHKYALRWQVKPGITGLSQLYSGRGKRVSWFCDDYYVKNASVFMDAKILLLSACILLFGKRRVKRWWLV